MLKEIILSIKAFFNATHLLTAKKQYKWFLVTGILYASLFGLGLYFYFATANTITHTILTKTYLKTWLQSNGTVVSFYFIITLIMLQLVLVIYYFSVLKYAIFIIASPLFAYTSSKTYAFLTKEMEHKSTIKMLPFCKYIISIALQNMVWQTLHFLLYIILCFVPIFGCIVPLVAIITECYYYGYGTTSMAFYVHKKNTVPLLTFIQKHKGLAIGNGLGFYSLHIVPLIGWVVAPVYTLVAAHTMLHQIDIENNTTHDK